MNLSEIIYNSFNEGAKAKPERTEVTFAPSYLSKCGRAIAYGKLGYEPTNPPDLPALLKMGWGDILHDDIQQRLVKAGVMESFEEFKTIEHEGLTFNYFYDGIVSENGVRWIIEIKTVYSSGYKAIEERPKEEHVLQCLSYMIFEKIDRAIILYAGRDNGYLKQHYLELHDDLNGSARLLVGGADYGHLAMWKEKVEKMKRIKAQVEKKELPDRDYSIVLKNTNGEIATEFVKDKEKLKSDWQCSYCSHYSLCWANELEEIKKHKFYINNKFS